MAVSVATNFTVSSCQRHNLHCNSKIHSSLVWSLPCHHCVSAVTPHKPQGKGVSPDGDAAASGAGGHCVARVGVGEGSGVPGPRAK